MQVRPIAGGWPADVFDLNIARLFCFGMPPAVGFFVEVAQSMGYAIQNKTCYTWGFVRVFQKAANINSAIKMPP